MDAGWWTRNGAAVQGIATIVLVVITAYYAWQSRRVAKDTEQLASETKDLSVATESMVRATEQANEIAREQVAAALDQVDAARTAQAAAVQPFIAQLTDPVLEGAGSVYIFDAREVSLGWGEVYVCERGSHGIDVSVPFRNTGVGTALLTGLGVNARVDVGWGGDFTKAVVGPGEIGRVLSTVPPDRPELEHLLDALESSGALTILISYTDVVGRKCPVTQLHLVRFDDGWRVRQTLVGTPGEPPIAGSCPVDARVVREPGR